MINARYLKKFSEAVKSYLLFDANNLKQIKKLFNLVIDKDEAKFEEFEKTLPNLKKNLKMI